MAIISQKLAKPLLDASATEDVEKLLTASGLRVERIVSHGHTSPEDFWYDQAEAEWVMVFRGAARLQIEGETQPRTLQAGDAVYLPPHCRHRVDWTDPNQTTVWLAIFVDPELQPTAHAATG